jgi:hypothetical protein
MRKSDVLLALLVVALCSFSIAIALSWPAESTIPDLVYGQF